MKTRTDCSPDALLSPAKREGEGRERAGADAATAGTGGQGPAADPRPTFDVTEPALSLPSPSLPAACAAVGGEERAFSYAFAASPCGGLRLGLCGTEVVMRASGALWLEAARALVVADLHLEKGSSYAARGQMLPPYDTRETLVRLEAEVEMLAPQTVVLLGDSFHDRKAEARLAAEDAGRLRALAAGRTLVWVVGNHDADGPQALPGETAAVLAIGPLTFRHEPQAGPQAGEVAGHLHPAARVRAPRGTVRRRCFVTDGERAILPAFGAYAGGLNVRDQAFAGLFVRPPLAGALGAARVRAVGWRRLAKD